MKSLNEDSVNEKEEMVVQENVAENTDEIDKIKQKIEEIIERHYAEEFFDVNEIMRDFSMSRVQFYQLFKRLYHDTPNNYVRRLRLEKSKTLILENKYTYAEIAYKIGFSSPAYFSKCFKDEYNCTPSEFFEQKRK